MASRNQRTNQKGFQKSGPGEGAPQTPLPTWPIASCDFPTLASGSDHRGSGNVVGSTSRIRSRRQMRGGVIILHLLHDLDIAAFHDNQQLITISAPHFSRPSNGVNCQQPHPAPMHSLF